MPTYEFKNKETGEIVEHVLRMTEKDQFLLDHPNLTSHFGTPLKIITGFHQKPDSGFRDLLKTIKKGNSRGFTDSTVNTF